MTAPNGPILFNNSTGSDTTASGLGAANVYGTGASTTGASAVVTGISTTGVSAGDLLWVQSSSGRQFSIIASVDSSTQVTCDDTFANTESGRTWAIGGKRAGGDLSTDPLFLTEAPAGATIEIEYTGTDYTNTASFQPNYGTTTAPVTIKGTGSDKPRICSPAGNIQCVRIRAGAYIIEDLQFIGKKTSGGAIGVWSMYGKPVYLIGRRLVFKSEQTQNGSSLVSDGQNTGTQPQIFEDCLFDGNSGKTAIGYNRTGGAARHSPIFVGCTFKDLTNCGIFFGDTRGSFIKNNFFIKCNDGIQGQADTYGQNVIEGNIFYDLDGDGIKFQRDDLWGNHIQDNIFHTIGGNGISAPSTYDSSKMSVMDYNAFYNVTGSNFSNLTSGANNITLTADPFVSAANGNFNLNDFPGGGNLLRAKYYELGGN